MTFLNLLNEYWYFLLLIILAASATGFFAGLFGIGGGLISVPFLFFIFGTLNISDDDYLMHLTVGTAFSITILTSASSVLMHKKNNLVDFEGTEIKISSSGGVAFSTETETSADLTNKADERLYEAKKNGRNRFTLHDSELVGE